MGIYPSGECLAFGKPVCYQGRCFTTPSHDLMLDRTQPAPTLGSRQIACCISSGSRVPVADEPSAGGA